MPAFAAVVAHFDPHNQLDPTFREVLDGLLSVVKRLILVTTSDLPSHCLADDPRVTVIRRPNIGYDFYSYRVGLDVLREEGPWDGIFIGNSSFILASKARFVACLREMAERSTPDEIQGFTKSFMMERHLQSYLLLIPKKVFESGWFSGFVRSIAPTSTKFDLIHTYEVGLSRHAALNKVSIGSLLRLRFREYCGACVSAIRSAWATRPVIEALGFTLFGRWAISNPVHFAAPALAERCGIIKTELLKDNPHKVDTAWANRAISPESQPLVDAYLSRIKPFVPAGVPLLKGATAQRMPLPWTKVIPVPGTRPGKPDIAVIVHAYYLEPLQDLCGLLKHITEPFDLIVTTPHEADVPLLLDILGPYAANLTIAVCENRGRDIGPFMSLLRKGVLAPYRAVLKLHLKKSLYSPNGDSWRQSLFDGLCGNALTVQRCISLLRGGKVGLIGPHEYFLTNPKFWGANRRKVSAILSAAGVADSTQHEALAFFAGSMFWFNPAALEPMRSMPGDLLDFEPEAGVQDGTTAHAIERVFTQVTKHAGFSVTSEQLLGGDVYAVDASHHGVPVL